MNRLRAQPVRNDDLHIRTVAPQHMQGLEVQQGSKFRIAKMLARLVYQGISGAANLRRSFLRRFSLQPPEIGAPGQASPFFEAGIEEAVASPWRREAKLTRRRKGEAPRQSRRLQ